MSVLFGTTLLYKEVYTHEELIMQIIERQEQLIEDIQNFKRDVLPTYEL